MPEGFRMVFLSLKKIGLKWIILPWEVIFQKRNLWIWKQIQVFWWVAKKQAFESAIFATGLAGSGDFFRRKKRSKQRVGLDQAGVDQLTLYDFQLVSNPCGERKHVSCFWRRHCKIPNGFCQTPVHLGPTSSYRAWFMFFCSLLTLNYLQD